MYKIWIIISFLTGITNIILAEESSTVSGTWEPIRVNNFDYCLIILFYYFTSLLMVLPDSRQHVTLPQSDLSNRQIRNLCFGLKCWLAAWSLWTKVQIICVAQKTVQGPASVPFSSWSPAVSLCSLYLLSLPKPYFSWNPKSLHKLFLFPKIGEKIPSCQELWRFCDFCPTSSHTSWHGFHGCSEETWNPWVRDKPFITYSATRSMNLMFVLVSLAHRVPQRQHGVAQENAAYRVGSRHARGAPFLGN